MEQENDMRDYEKETSARIAFIKERLADAHADGIIYGNSGGKDCTLVGILCKMACDNTVGVVMPCQSSRNYGSDMQDAFTAAAQYGIETLTVDLSAVKEQFMTALGEAGTITDAASSNINPRLRMTTLYALGQSRNALVAGTGNRSERYMGYFTKWGDGACDFNPIADLTVEEIYEYLAYFDAPLSTRTKAPSAGLYEGQTDEDQMGVSYQAIDDMLLRGIRNEGSEGIIERAHRVTAHKRRPIPLYADPDGEKE